jgi:hypothetical protein
LRHDATPHIVPMYQIDISGRQFAVARLTPPATTRQLTGKKPRTTPAAAGKGSNKN